MWEVYSTLAAIDVSPAVDWVYRQFSSQRAKEFHSHHAHFVKCSMDMIWFSLCCSSVFFLFLFRVNEEKSFLFPCGVFFLLYSECGWIFLMNQSRSRRPTWPCHDMWYHDGFRIGCRVKRYGNVMHIFIPFSYKFFELYRDLSTLLPHWVTPSNWTLFALSSQLEAAHISQTRSYSSPRRWKRIESMAWSKLKRIASSLSLSHTHKSLSKSTSHFHKLRREKGLMWEAETVLDINLNDRTDTLTSYRVYSRTSIKD